MNPIERLCILDTPYSLLVYLIYSSEKDIRNTFFIFGENMPRGLENHLNAFYVVHKVNLFNRRMLRWVYYKYIKYFILHGVTPSTHIYGHDHLPFSSVIIGNRYYTMIEDSQNICTNYICGKMHERILENRKTLKNRLYRTLYGKLYDCAFAENHQCTSILMTKEDYAEYISDKEHIVFSMPELWKRSSQEKKDLILRCFNVNKSDVEVMNRYKIILFTQPLTDIVDENTQKEIFRLILSHYSKDDILIKVHPRDKLDYKQLFPDYAVFKKQIPSQLLDLLGVKYDKAVTCFSSAVSMFNYPIKIDWYGTEIHKELFRKVGHIDVPQIAGLNICRESNPNS